MEQKITKDIVVFYHGNCRDGFTAAWAAWKKFGENADYIPMIWTNIDPKVPDVTGKEVYFLDFVPTDAEFERVRNEAKSAVIIDHHVSKEALTKSVPGSVYDVNHSGAVLAWKYFHPDTEVPRLCLFVEDSDLWNWEIPNSAEVLIYVDLKWNLNFKDWDLLAVDLEDENKIKEYIGKGAVALAYGEKIVDIIVKQHAQLVNFEGHEVYAVNGPRYFRSEIGEKLYEMKPPFGIIWNYTSTEISVSLRAKKGEFDLTPLAGKYGGGGHAAASNFRLPLGSPLPWKIINKE